MSMHAIREAFATAATRGLRCVAARMSYTGDRRDHQILEFDIVRASDNMKTTVVTDPIKCGDSLTAAAAKAAAVAAKVLALK